MRLIAHLVFNSIEAVFYVHWVVCIIVGFISYICLFFVLWHLGSKDLRKEFPDFKSETTGTTTLQVDNILRLVPNEEASFIEVEEHLTDLTS